MDQLKDILRSRRDIILEGFDPLSSEGFCQVPNVILRHPTLSPGAKLTYAMLLSYAWQNDYCFPGQERLATDIGTGKRSIVKYIQELESVGYLTTKRRGLGKTNIYTIRTRSR